MTRSFRAITLALLAGAVLAAPSAASGQEAGQAKRTYFALAPATAVYAEPAARAKVAALVIHRTANYTTHIACNELPKRGIAALCMSTRFTNNEFAVDWDRIALDVKAGVEFLRKQQGIEKVVLFGHSGGGPTTSFYQAVAENGLGFCKDPQRLVPCRDDLAGMPKADGLILADAHPGVPVILLRSLNGSVLDETAGKFDAALDPYLTSNGYSATASSTYSPEFQTRYFAAQSARMNALIATAQGRVKAIREGKGTYPDNDLFAIPHGGNPGAGPGGASQLHSLDTAIPLRRTRAPQKLVRNDGSIVEQIVTSVSPPELDTKETTNSFDRGTKILSLRSFLSTQAVRSSNSLDGIDHCSSNNSTICAVRSIAAPTLVVGMGGYLFIRDSEEEYENSAAAKKELLFIEGASHGFTPCRNCSADPDAYANSVRNLFDQVKNWVDATMR
jgi:pimeloyl-ACP methyl ester carboxylesterase